MKPDQFKRTVFVYGEEFWEFYNAQSKSVQDKIDWVIWLVRTLQVVPQKFLKYLEGTEGLYEIRVRLGNNIFRIFCFFDKEDMVILVSGIHKKSNKTPKNQIEKAIRLKNQYHDEQKK